MTTLIVAVPLCVLVPNAASAAEATAARAQTMLQNGKHEAAADLYLQAFRETRVEAHARQAGLIYLKLGPERAADARYALTLYLRAAKKPEQQREAKDLLLIAGDASGPPAKEDGTTTVTTETTVDGKARTLTHSEVTAAGESTTTLDGQDRTLTHTERDADGTSTTAIDGSDGAVSHTSVSADGREEVDANASRDGASYEKRVDCSKDPSNPRQLHVPVVQLGNSGHERLRRFRHDFTARRRHHLHGERRVGHGRSIEGELSARSRELLVRAGG